MLKKMAIPPKALGGYSLDSRGAANTRTIWEEAVPAVSSRTLLTKLRRVAPVIAASADRFWELNTIRKILVD
jgi:hypothetical protein